MSPVRWSRHHLNSLHHWRVKVSSVTQGNNIPFFPIYKPELLLETCSFPNYSWDFYYHNLDGNFSLFLSCILHFKSKPSRAHVIIIIVTCLLICWTGEQDYCWSVLFCTIICIIFTSLCKKLVKLTWVLADAFRCHGHHFQCLTVLMELSAMFRFVLVGLAEMLLWLLCMMVSKSVWDF